MLLDTLARPLRTLRLSVTDRCNLRCQYCMPEDDYAWLPREDLLTFEEVSALVDVFLALGVHTLHFTGGEPLLRRDLPALVAMLASKPGLDDLALTTNGVLLGEQAEALKATGLHRITVSLDTLHAARFKALTRFDRLAAVLAGITEAGRLFGRVKLNTIVIKGVNDDELADLIEYGRTRDAEVRFIEYMDVGGANRWSADRVVSRREILDGLVRRYGPIEPISESTAAPADRFALRDGTVFGIISSTTQPFCQRCDRSRLTADGLWYLCLYAEEGIDLRTLLRRGASAEELNAIVARGWRAREDRGAEQRRSLGDRRVFLPLQLLTKNSHLEMHTRGG